MSKIFAQSIGTLKSIRKASHILPALLAIATQKPRYRPEIKWGKSPTYNLFRLYEIIFWSRATIRREASANFHRDQKTNKVYVVYKFHTIEALLVNIEQSLFGLAKSTYLSIVRTMRYWQWKLDRLIPQITGIFDIPEWQASFVGVKYEPKTLNGPSALVFAIAHDTFLNTTNSASFSYTVTGANPELVFGMDSQVGGGAPTVTAAYNSVSMTLLDQIVSNTWQNSFILTGPSTGANTFAQTSSGTIFDGKIISYSGVQQTGEPDNHGTGSATTGAPGQGVSTNFTTTAPATWIVQWMYCNNGVQTGGSGYTDFGTANASGANFSDTAGEVSNGVHAVAFTCSSFGNLTQNILSIIPAAGGATAVVSVPTLLFMNVG